MNENGYYPKEKWSFLKDKPKEGKTTQNIKDMVNILISDDIESLMKIILSPDFNIWMKLLINQKSSC